MTFHKFVKYKTFQIASRLCSSVSDGSSRYWSSNNVRNAFIQHYKTREHRFVPSSSVIPKKDDGIYFINAGMNQFKPIFLGTVNQDSEMANYNRVVNSQKCIRVGGKHNDLDDVGKDTYHHTFFEMLGSWSFGDYFKRDACRMAWELLTQEYKIPKDRLYVSYFGGNQRLNIKEDLECKEIWRELGVPNERLLPFGMKDNFWDMGEVGPCGPCTEIHYDHLGRSTEQAAHLVNTDCPSVVELWNLVFMQFDRQSDGSLLRLPNQHVDTGMGLERLTAVLQGTQSNYNTDLFLPLFQHIHQKAGCPTYNGKLGSEDVKQIDTAYRIVADHARMFTVALSDGLLPGTTDASGKLRHVIYRCIRQATDVLKAPRGTVGSLVPLVVQSLGEAHPQLQKNVKETEEIVHYMEERYHQQVRVGKKMFKKAIQKYDLKQGQCLTGEQMHEICSGRFGKEVPPDIFLDIVESHNLAVDVDSYDSIIYENQKGSGGADGVGDRNQKLTTQDLVWLNSQHIQPTDDSYVYKYSASQGKYTFDSLRAKVVALKHNGEFVDQITTDNSGGSAIIITDKTCFYAEKGGQVGDSGYMRTDTGGVFRVEDTQVSQNYVLHSGVLESGEITNSCPVNMNINSDDREACMRNHTATHILNYCLWKCVGKTRQQGSIVNQHKLTFSFSLETFLPWRQIYNEELSEISNLANELIKNKLPVHTEELELNSVKRIPGIRYLEDTVYPNTVRVVSVGEPISQLISELSDQSEKEVNCSLELCGGTHVDNTGDIVDFAVVGVEGETQGYKNITAVTGDQAVKVNGNGRLLRQKYEELKVLLANKSDRELLNVAVDDIKRILGYQMLPKVDRDFVESEITKAGIAIQKTIHFKDKLNITLQQVIENCKAQGVAVTFVGPSNLREVATVLTRLSIDIPVMVLFSRSRGDRTNQSYLYGVCHVPETLKSSHNICMDRWVSHVCGADSTTTPAYPRPKERFSKGMDMRVIDTGLCYHVPKHGVNNSDSGDSELQELIEKAKDFIISHDRIS